MDTDTIDDELATEMAKIREKVSEKVGMDQIVGRLDMILNILEALNARVATLENRSSGSDWSYGTDTSGAGADISWGNTSGGQTYTSSGSISSASIADNAITFRHDDIAWSKAAPLPTNVDYHL